MFLNLLHVKSYTIFNIRKTITFFLNYHKWFLTIMILLPVTASAVIVISTSYLSYIDLTIVVSNSFLKCQNRRKLRFLCYLKFSRYYLSWYNLQRLSNLCRFVGSKCPKAQNRLT